MPDRSDQRRVGSHRFWPAPVSLTRLRLHQVFGLMDNNILFPHLEKENLCRAHDCTNASKSVSGVKPTNPKPSKQQEPESRSQLDHQRLVVLIKLNWYILCLDENNFNDLWMQI